MSADDHGMPSTYTNHRCRCEPCTAANTRRVLASRAKRDASTLPPEAHGKASTYGNWRCRCVACTAAWTAAERTMYGKRKARANGEG